jgi:hypothetical protein
MVSTRLEIIQNKNHKVFGLLAMALAAAFSIAGQTFAASPKTNKTLEKCANALSIVSLPAAAAKVGCEIAPPEFFYAELVNTICEMMASGTVETKAERSLATAGMTFLKDTIKDKSGINLAKAPSKFCASSLLLAQEILHEASGAKPNMVFEFSKFLNNIRFDDLQIKHMSNKILIELYEAKEYGDDSTMSEQVWKGRYMFAASFIAELFKSGLQIKGKKLVQKHLAAKDDSCKAMVLEGTAKVACATAIDTVSLVILNLLAEHCFEETFDEKKPHEEFRLLIPGWKSKVFTTAIYHTYVQVASKIIQNCFAEENDYSSSDLPTKEEIASQILLA